LYEVRPTEAVELLLSDLSFSKLNRGSFPDKEELLLHQEIVKSTLNFFSLLFTETQVVQPLIEHLPYIFIYALVNFEVYPQSVRVLLSNILLKSTSETTKLSHFLENQKYTLDFMRNTGTIREKVIEELSLSKIEDSQILVSYIDNILTIHDLISVFSVYFEKMSPSINEKIGRIALQEASQSQNPDVIFKLISIYSSVLRSVDEHSLKDLMQCTYNTSRYLEQSKTWKKMKQGIDLEYTIHMVQYLKIFKSLAQVFAEKGEFESCTLIFWIAVMFLGISVNDIYSAALDCLEYFKSNKVLSEMFFTNKVEESLKMYTTRFRPEFQGIQILLLKSFLKKETESIGIDFLMTLMEVDYDLIVEPSETRHMSAISLVLPFLYRESQNPSSFDQISAICEKFSSTIKNSLGEAIGKVDLLKSNPHQFMKNVCSEMAKLYFPQHATKCSDILYALTFGSPLNAPYIFKLATYFLELPNSKSYLVEFMSITRISCNLSKFQVEDILPIVSNSFKLSQEKNDNSKVNQKSKALAYHMNSIKPSSDVEIELSLKNMLDIHSKNIKEKKREMIEMKEEFDFKGAKIVDTTYSPNTKQYLMMKPALNKNIGNATSSSIPSIEVNEMSDLLPSEMKKRKDNELREEEIKKKQLEEDKLRAEAKEKQKKEKQIFQQENSYIVSCLQKFSLKWREQARTVVLTSSFQDEESVIDELINDTESCELLENFAKDHKIDILFYRSVLDFKDETGMTESLIAAKEIIEHFIKSDTFGILNFF
jgi:hypothetical protein